MIHNFLISWEVMLFSAYLPDDWLVLMSLLHQVAITLARSVELTVNIFFMYVSSTPYNFVPFGKPGIQAFHR